MSFCGVILHRNNLAVTGRLRKSHTKKGGVNAKMPIGIIFRAVRTFIFRYSNYRERIHLYNGQHLVYYWVKILIMTFALEISLYNLSSKYLDRAYQTGSFMTAEFISIYYILYWIQYWSATDMRQTDSFFSLTWLMLRHGERDERASIYTYLQIFTLLCCSGR